MYHDHFLYMADQGWGIVTERKLSVNWQLLMVKSARFVFGKYPCYYFATLLAVQNKNKINLMANILIIDDSPQMGFMLQEITKMLGHTPQFAQDPISGVALARKIDPDIVLLDVMMPKLSGWEVFQQIRDFSKAPVIFVTANNTAENRARASHLGASLFSKDVHPRILKETIDQLLI